MQINPVFRKELKLGVRSARLPIVMLIYNSVLAFISLLVFYTIIESARWSGIMDYTSVIVLYIVVVGIEGVLLAFFIVRRWQPARSPERGTPDPGYFAHNPYDALWDHFRKAYVFSEYDCFTCIFQYSGYFYCIYFRRRFAGGCYKIVLYLIFAAVFFSAQWEFPARPALKDNIFNRGCLRGVLGLCAGTVLIVIVGALVAAVSATVSIQSVVGILALILLLNPGMTAVAMLVGQLAYSSISGTVFHDVFGIPMFFSEHWVIISIILQLGFMILLLWGRAAHWSRKNKTARKGETPQGDTFMAWKDGRERRNPVGDTFMALKGGQERGNDGWMKIGGLLKLIFVLCADEWSLIF